MEPVGEVLVISSVLNGEDYAQVFDAGVSVEHFLTFPDEWEWIETHCLEYRQAPSKTLFKSKFPDFPLKKVKELAAGIDIVRTNYLTHRLSKSMSEATKLIRSGEPEKALSLMHSASVNLEMEYDTNNGGTDVIRDWQETYAGVVDRVERATDGVVHGIPTGLITPDTRTGGIQPSELWIIAARLGEGKTWGLLNSAAEAVLAGKTAVVNSLEMSRAQCEYRLHAILAEKLGRKGISHNGIVRGDNLSLKDYRDFLVDLPKQVPGRLFISDNRRGRVTPLTLAGQCERNNPDVIYIDYLTLMGSSTGGRATDDWRVAASISADVKEVATKYDVAIYAAAQLNREGGGGMGKMPTTKNLAQSDNIGQDADAVITMRRMKPSTCEFLMSKYRHGTDGYRFYAKQNPTSGVFTEITKDEALLEDEDE